MRPRIGGVSVCHPPLLEAAIARARHTLGLVMAAGSLLAPALAHAAPPRLHANVAPYATITLRLSNADYDIISLPAGRYRLIVEDRGGAGNIFSSDKGFHLAGPHGLDTDITSPAFVGVVAITLTLHAGTYHYWATPTGAGHAKMFVVLPPESAV
jgi:hypothetical protein